MILGPWRKHVSIKALACCVTALIGGWLVGAIGLAVSSGRLTLTPW